MSLEHDLLHRNELGSDKNRFEIKVLTHTSASGQNNTAPGAEFVSRKKARKVTAMQLNSRMVGSSCLSYNSSGFSCSAAILNCDISEVKITITFLAAMSGDNVDIISGADNQTSNCILKKLHQAT